MAYATGTIINDGTINALKKAFDRLGVNIPDWLPTEYKFMPRLVEKMEDIDDYIIVDVETNEANDAEMMIWIVENLEYKWNSAAIGCFSFEDKNEAMRFKLQWK